MVAVIKREYDANGVLWTTYDDGARVQTIDVGGPSDIQSALDAINGETGAAADENWIPGAFGSSSFAPGSMNFDLCKWLYEKTGIKCWWIIAALAALVLIQAAGSVGRLRDQRR